MSYEWNDNIQVTRNVLVECGRTFKVSGGMCDGQWVEWAEEDDDLDAHCIREGYWCTKCGAYRGYNGRDRGVK